jgi:hypothetical protein
LTEQLPFPGWDEIAPVNSCARCGVTIVAWDIRCKKCARLCLDCDKDTVTGDGDYYMVRDEVWAASGVTPGGGMLCITCLERRVGRELTLADFRDDNEPLREWGLMALDRLRRERGRTIVGDLLVP